MSTPKIDRDWYPCPVGYGICPVCNGTAIVELSEKEKLNSWNKGETHRSCGNCGGQTMASKASGFSKIDPSTGKGCSHGPYITKNLGRCYNGYTCTKCNFNYTIDSSD
jgi:hypothetical protein